MITILTISQDSSCFMPDTSLFVSCMTSHDCHDWTLEHILDNENILLTQLIRLTWSNLIQTCNQWYFDDISVKKVLINNNNFYNVANDTPQSSCNFDWKKSSKRIENIKAQKEIKLQKCFNIFSNHTLISCSKYFQRNKL